MVTQWCETMKHGRMAELQCNYKQKCRLKCVLLHKIQHGAKMLKAVIIMAAKCTTSSYTLVKLN